MRLRLWIGRSQDTERGAIIRIQKLSRFPRFLHRYLPPVWREGSARSAYAEERN